MFNVQVLVVTGTTGTGTDTFLCSKALAAGTANDSSGTYNIRGINVKVRKYNI